MCDLLTKLKFELADRQTSRQTGNIQEREEAKAAAATAAANKQKQASGNSSLFTEPAGAARSFFLIKRFNFKNSNNFISNNPTIFATTLFI